MVLCMCMYICMCVCVCVYVCVCVVVLLHAALHIAPPSAGVHAHMNDDDLEHGVSTSEQTQNVEADDFT